MSTTDGILEFLRRDLPKDVWNVVYDGNQPIVITAMQILNRSSGKGMFTIAFGDNQLEDGHDAIDGNYELREENLKSVLYSGELDEGEYYYWYPKGGRIVISPNTKMAIAISQVDLEVSIFGAEV